MSKVGRQSVAESTGGGKGFLLGRYDHALDPKKRFTIPAGWRQILGDPQYVSPSRLDGGRFSAIRSMSP